MEHSLATELTRQLIQIESTDPGTYELTIKDWICSWLISALHADVRLYQDEVLPNRFNLMAELPGTDRVFRLLSGSAIWIRSLSETAGLFHLFLLWNVTAKFTAEELVI